MSGISTFVPGCSPIVIVGKPFFGAGRKTFFSFYPYKSCQYGLVIVHVVFCIGYCCSSCIFDNGLFVSVSLATSMVLKSDDGWFNHVCRYPFLPAISIIGNMISGFDNNFHLAVRNVFFVMPVFIVSR